MLGVIFTLITVARLTPLTITITVAVFTFTAFILIIVTATIRIILYMSDSIPKKKLPSARGENMTACLVTASVKDTMELSLCPTSRSTSA
jgi:hypothetical protein